MASQAAGRDQITRLRELNAALRAELKLEEPRPEKGDSVEWLERENRMLEHQIKLLKQNQALLKTEAGQQEALYLLQFLQTVPLPTWSADLQAKIVHWGGAAEKTYSYAGEHALGRNFIDLFVSEAEKKQAEDDLVCIIFGQEGLAHFNLCKDKDADNDQVYLVTCCFPVFDPRSNRIVQAEISFDLSRLPALEQELDDMYRRHRAEEDSARQLRIARERAVIETLTRQLFAEVKDHYDVQRERLEKSIVTNREKLADDNATRVVREFHEGELRRNQSLLDDLDTWEADMKNEIARADTHKSLEGVQITIRKRTRKNV